MDTSSVNPEVSKQKRKRSPNFTKGEKSLFLKLVQPYRHLIDSKKCDGDTSRQKNKVWQEIATRFNKISKHGFYRSAKSLRSYYDAHRKETRRLMRKRQEAESAEFNGDFGDGQLLFKNLGNDEDPLKSLNEHFTQNTSTSKTESENDNTNDADTKIFVAEVEEHGARDSDDNLNVDAGFICSASYQSNAKTNYYKEVSILKLQLLREQVAAAREEHEANRRIRELQIQSLELDIQLKQQQLMSNHNFQHHNVNNNL